MRIKDILSPESMIMDLKAKNKEDAIKEMADLEVATDIVNDEDAFIKSIWDRENESTTGIGGGIAMPHARNKSINKARVLFAKSKDGIDYNSLDGQPVHLFFMITAPAGADNTHLQALAKLSGLLIDPDLVEKLKATKTPEEVIDLFEKAEAKKDEEDKKAAEAKKAKEAAKAEGKNDDDDNKPLIVGVTACINGIAHTYMAQEALIKEGKKRGIEVRIETNGSEGVKDKLTPDEIKRAKGVIIASDKKVDMPRFDGKPLVNHPVVDGINKPGELIDDIMDGKADVYHASASDKSEESSSSTEKPGVWAGIYKNLMNGISHMLPFVIGGGILMAISFIVENYGGGAKTPAFIFLNNAGNLAFAFMVPVLSAYIAESIGDLPALMPGFVGGYMASIANGQFQVNVQAHATSPAGFLGGIAAGFIAGYLMVGLKKLFANLPHSVEGMKPMLFYPILGLLFIAAIMFYIINPIFSGINFAITHFLNSMGTGNLVLLTTILAGMMSIDMGGPFNKASYVFGVASIASGNYNIMAAVMIGGMVPPCAIALATLLFKKKFTESERKSGPTNFIMGLAFITEGAIPFAAADPLHVIPSCAVGSALAGALSMAFNCTLMAPHGGIFVFPVVGNTLMYLVALVAGTIVGAVLLGLLKKDVA